MCNISKPSPSAGGDCGTALKVRHTPIRYKKTKIDWEALIYMEKMEGDPSL